MGEPERLPAISIVVPSFNQGRYLSEALESVFRQEYPRLEVVVMDGGSTDESKDVIHTYAPRLAYWKSQPDEGQSSAINAGVARCGGDLVAWLNSDDRYHHDALWTVGRAWAALPRCGLYVGNGFRLQQTTGRLEPFGRRHVVLNRQALAEGLDYILQPSTFFLRQAWEEVGGLRETLRFCMDWDVILRISRRHPAVLINEFLALSREHEETKTSQGGLGRVLEIADMVTAHTQRPLTPGVLFYALEELLGLTSDMSIDPVRHHIHAGMMAIRSHFAEVYGNADGFPERGDPQDRVYVPAATLDVPARFQVASGASLPSVSVVTPSFNQARYLPAALESILSQGYPRLETFALDGESTDGSVDVLRGYSERLTYWASEPDRGPAHAINKGFAKATGEVVGWLNSDDVLAQDALWHVGRAFADDPDLDMVYGNALYVDEESRLFLADHGTCRTGLYYGEMRPAERIPAYWQYVHAVPQPTVFFRRRLIERCGMLDESYHFIFDFELFFRFSRTAKVRKLEHTLALYRIHSASKTSGWNNFLVELYRFSRPWWPPVGSEAFRSTLRSYVGAYTRRRLGARRGGPVFWGVAGLVALMAITRLGNPEALRLRRADGGRPRWGRRVWRSLSRTVAAALRGRAGGSSGGPLSTRGS